VRPGGLEEAYQPGDERVRRASMPVRYKEKAEAFSRADPPQAEDQNPHPERVRGDPAPVLFGPRRGQPCALALSKITNNYS
jgi:hypothetical protein